MDRGYGGGWKETNELDDITRFVWDVVVNNLSVSLRFELIVEQECESILTLNSRGNLVGVGRKLCVNSLLHFHCRYVDLLSVRRKVSKASIWFCLKQIMNEPKTLYLSYCQSNTLLDYPLLVWCLFFFVLFFWRYFQVFVHISASTKSENFASFDHTNPKSSSRHFCFSTTAIVWLHIL